MTATTWESIRGTQFEYDSSFFVRRSRSEQVHKQMTLSGSGFEKGVQTSKQGERK